MSRLPLPDPLPEVPDPPEMVLLMEHLASTPVSAQQIKRLTDRDPVLSEVKKFVLQGWPLRSDPMSEDLLPFTRRKLELSVQDGCLLWGSRVVVPSPVQVKVMEELHGTHPGISRMKSLARQYVWWPGMDADLERKVKECSACQSAQKSPPCMPLHPWEWPHKPWLRIHADYAGPFQGRTLLILVDAHSKWMDVHITSSATSAVTIEKMRSSFATLGLPEIMVTDNGPAFTSMEFAQFMQRNGIRHVKTAPYHPASNGLAERTVQTVKEGLRKMVDGSLETRLSRFLFHYRISPHSTTGVSPAELVMGNRLRSHLDLLQPQVGMRVRRNQDRQKESHDQHGKERDLSSGERVYAENFGKGARWLPGILKEANGPVSFTVELEDGRIIRRHSDHLRSRTDIPRAEEQDFSDDLPQVDPDESIPVEKSEPPPLAENSTQESIAPDSAQVHNSWAVCESELNVGVWERNLVLLILEWNSQLVGVVPIFQLE